MGSRRRYSVVDCTESLRVLGGVSLEQFRTNYEALIQTRLTKDLMARELQWTESMAVGSRAFVEAIAKSVTHRQRLTYSTVGESVWTLREDLPAAPELFLGSRNDPVKRSAKTLQSRSKSPSALS